MIFDYDNASKAWLIDRAREQTIAELVARFVAVCAVCMAVAFMLGAV